VASKKQSGGLSTARIEAFSDGVFAIAITLLVFNLHVPTVSDQAALQHELAKQWLSYLSYLLSVVVIGVYWVAHHGLFTFIQRADRPLFWLNILFIACVAFLPFPTALLGQYGHSRLAVVIYGLSLVVTGLVLDSMRAYATRGRRLVHHDLPDEVVRSGRRRNLRGPAIYALAIGIALLPFSVGPVDGPACALALYIVVPLTYILPGRIDRYWASRHDSTDHHNAPHPAAPSQQAAHEEAERTSL